SNALHALGGEAADLALVVLTAQAATDAAGVARAVIGATRGWSIPVAAAFVGGPRVAAGAHALEDAGGPCYAFPEPAVKTLGGMALYAARRRRQSDSPRFTAEVDTAHRHLARLRSTGIDRLEMSELVPLLEAYGIACAATGEAATPMEAATTAARLGFPVAVKLRSPDITHKTDVRGVILGLRTSDD